MWVIPETSEFCHFVQGTEVLKLDYPEHWIQHLMSCLWRSNATLKPSSVKMRLKKHKWLRKLCGMILKPSQQKDFEDALIIYLQDSPANLSRSPASEKGKATLDGFGMILKESLRQLDLFGASSRMSPDSCPLDSPQFIEAYEIWVTKLRLDCLRRQKSVQQSKGKDCIYWPRPTVST